MKKGETITVNNFIDPITNEIKKGAFQAEIIRIVETRPLYNYVEIKVVGEKRNRVKMIYNQPRRGYINQFGFSFDYFKKDYVFQFGFMNDTFFAVVDAYFPDLDKVIVSVIDRNTYFKSMRIERTDEKITLTPDSEIFKKCKPVILKR